MISLERLRPDVLEETEALPAGVVEDVARAVRDLERPPVRIPAPLPQGFRSGFQVLDLICIRDPKFRRHFCQRFQGSNKPEECLMPLVQRALTSRGNLTLRQQGCSDNTATVPTVSSD